MSDEWVASHISTLIHTILYPDIQYRTSTKYATDVTTSYLTNHRFTTSTGLVLLSFTYYLKNTNTHIEDSTINRTTTVTREISQIIYSHIVSTTMVPRFDVLTIYDQVTKTNTFTETLQHTIASTVPYVKVISSTSFHILEPSPLVKTHVVTPICSVDGLSVSESAAVVNVFAAAYSTASSTTYSAASSTIYFATSSASSTDARYNYESPLFTIIS